MDTTGQQGLEYIYFLPYCLAFLSKFSAFWFLFFRPSGLDLNALASLIAGVLMHHCPSSRFHLILSSRFSRKSFSCLLCISTRERVLCTLFDGQNHLFLHYNKFFCIFPSLAKKRKKKGKPHKNMQSTSFKE